jgi:hypothetical protein
MTAFACLALIGLIFGRILPYYGSSGWRHTIPYALLVLGVLLMTIFDGSIDLLAFVACFAIVSFVHMLSIAEKRHKDKQHMHAPEKRIEP